MNPNTNTPPPYTPPSSPEPVVPNPTVPVAPQTALPVQQPLQPASPPVTKRSKLGLWALILNIAYFALSILAIISIVIFFLTAASGWAYQDGFGTAIILLFVFVGICFLIFGISIAALVLDILYLKKDKPVGTPKILTIVSICILGLNIIAGPVIGFINTLLNSSSW